MPLNQNVAANFREEVESGILPSPIMVEDIQDEFGSSPNALIVKSWYEKHVEEERFLWFFRR